MAKNNSAPQIIFISFIKAYQKYISPLSPPNCRFTPTCSYYAIEAITQFGVIKGTWLAIKRIAKCHPLNEGGEDPVPQKNKCCDKSKLKHK